MAIQPLGDRVLVEPLAEDSGKVGSLFIPDSAQEKPQKGTVVEKGDLVEGGIEKGDIVLYGKFAGTEIEQNGTGYLIIEASDILAKVD